MHKYEICLFSGSIEKVETVIEKKIIEDDSKEIAANNTKVIREVKNLIKDYFEDKYNNYYRFIGPMKNNLFVIDFGSWSRFVLIGDEKDIEQLLNSGDTTLC